MPKCECPECNRNFTFVSIVEKYVDSKCEKIFMRGVLEALLNAEMDAEYYKERCKELETKAKE